MSEDQLKEQLIKGDFLREDDDAYVAMLAKNEKKNLYLKVVMGAFYITLLVASLFIV